MRTKIDVMDDARRDIRDVTQRSDTDQWLEYRKIEVLCDIRDILNGQLMDIEKTTRERSEIPV